ncbi:MAG: porin [Burkholderiaceae bacterium]|nr:porin [Burkholderiaceae bacterium]
MKKTLLAAALLAGFAGAASAQSSVTLYGVLDGGVRYQNWNLSSGPFSKVDISTSSIAVQTGSQSTSRFGVRGVEDLGSGNQAVWNLEGQVNVNDGSAGSFGTWQRAAIVGLQNNAWGRFDIGRQLNLAFKFAGGPIDSAFGVNAPIINISGVMGITAVRQSNMLMYQSPTMSGFKVGAQYSFNTGLTTLKQAATGGTSADTAVGSSFDTGNNMRNISGAVSYTNSGIYVTGVYDQFTPANNTVAGQNGTKVTSWIVAGAYDAKVVKVGAAYNQVRGGLINGAATSSVSSDIVNPFANGGIVFAEGAGTNAWNINASAPVGANGTVSVAYQGLSHTGVVADVGGATQLTWGLGYSYKFTNRTNVYAIYSYVNNYLGIAGLSGNTGTVGLRHAF